MDETPVDNAKKHIKRYKTAYIVVASLVLGVVIGRNYWSRRRS